MQHVLGKSDAPAPSHPEDNQPAVRTGTGARIQLTGIADDRAMLRAAAELTRDLQRPNPWIYWPDFLGSTAVGYAALAGVIWAPTPLATVAFWVIAVIALYRATLFIHEITHLNHALLPGFRFVWNLVLGVPTMLPSFMYEGIHIIHHTRTRYGTVEDPEYLPLALMKPWSLPLFLLISVLMPVGLLLRFGVLGPLSMVIPPLRRVVVARFSGLQINPKYERRSPEGAFARQWFWEELGASVVAVSILATTALGILPLRVLLGYMVVISGVAVLNQIRTLVAHRWENEGDPLTVTAQYLDSTNVPDGVLPWIWAPVGLRFHALHHLLPSLPYHSLAEAHRRLAGALGKDSTYEQANYPTLRGLLGRLFASTLKQRAAH
ncbi:fatty acid desaturase [Novosphingobium nitrogenifigens DSM 19370]|uniref:Fatty acid desaturase n=1 Tax=Novosphingobium nitrogenifigens DSM 19370 TaxID=983920 RepID=F1Z826_9SPHN|nr:fatty acid desaturase [Novosphingobium nitrogenifigens]EGD59199.1 fatty acid desaturase [Novosphingobium nitrogenifigens DSM 19370]